MSRDIYAELGVRRVINAATRLTALGDTRANAVPTSRSSAAARLQGRRQASGLIAGVTSLLDAVRANASPLQPLARAMKVGKEEICGLVAAVERYVAPTTAPSRRRGRPPWHHGRRACG